MAARNMFIEIYEYPYKFMTFAHTLGRPHGAPLRVYVEIHKKLIHSKTVDICLMFCVYSFKRRI